jgi:hypothetical protein
MNPAEYVSASPHLRRETDRFYVSKILEYIRSPQNLNISCLNICLSEVVTILRDVRIYYLKFGYIRNKYASLFLMTKCAQQLEARSVHTEPMNGRYSSTFFTTVIRANIPEVTTVTTLCPQLES